METGIIVPGGMGGFMNPPTHPEHTYHVETDLRRRKWNRGGMSLSYATTCEWLTPSTRQRAQEKLDSWVKPAIDSAEVQEWILQVLGYFRDCYVGHGENGTEWNVGNLRIMKADPLLNADMHAGVHCIRKYYPEFVPTEEHFANAYWGTKPQLEAVGEGKEQGR